MGKKSQMSRASETCRTSSNVSIDVYWKSQKMKRKQGQKKIYLLKFKQISQWGKEANMILWVEPLGLTAEQTFCFGLHAFAIMLKNPRWDYPDLEGLCVKSYQYHWDITTPMTLWAPGLCDGWFCLLEHMAKGGKPRDTLSHSFDVLLATRLLKSIY